MISLIVSVAMTVFGGDVPAVPPVPPPANNPPTLDEALGLGGPANTPDTANGASELQRSLDGAKP